MDIKEIFSYLGVKEDEVKTMDDFKKKFDAEFLRSSTINEESEPVKKALGKTLGTIENDMKKLAKAYSLEVDFDSEDLKSKKVTEKMKVVLTKLDESKAAKIKELEDKAGQGADEKVKALEEKHEKLKNKYTTTEDLLKKTREEYEGFMANSTKREKTIKVDIYKKDLYGKAKVLPEVNEYAKKGFFHEFEEKFTIDLDENEKPVVLDKKGAPIPNPKTTGTFYDPETLLTEKLVEAKLYALNPNGGKPVVQTTQVQTPPATVTTGRVIARPMGS